jgi:DNA-binding GntR family transcriptional regulator
MKYKEVSEAIIVEIKSGDLLPGDKLPTEKELIKTYATSKMTIRKSIDYLREKGIVYSIKGSGAFVAPFSEYKVSNPFNERIEKTTIITNNSSTIIPIEYLKMFCKTESCKKQNA